MRACGYGLRTTGRYDETPWVYTEYETGERELYDLRADPWQLEDLSGRPRYAATEAALRTMLHERVIEPDDVRFLHKLRYAEGDG